MSELDSKGINQLLLSPLFLLNTIFGTLLPGILFCLLLGLKGNFLLHQGWSSPYFGYKTKVALFLVVAFVLGSMLKLPFHLISVAIRIARPQLNASTFLPGQPEAVRQAVSAIVTDGVLFARPALIDRLSLVQSDLSFHIGIGTCLIVASLIAGDGSLRVLEGLLGIAMFLMGVRKGVQYQETSIGLIGVGLADILAHMTQPQIAMLKAAIPALGLATKETANQSIEPSTSTTPSAAE